jgi:hypothetical protein
MMGERGGIYYEGLSELIVNVKADVKKLSIKYGVIRNEREIILFRFFHDGSL